jgi:NTP pyrophosphatase (non-canonical NTP hydrolase)
MRLSEARTIAAQAWQVVEDPGNLTCAAYADEALGRANPEVTEAEEAKHALLGLSGEVGEIADHFKKHLYMGHDLDRAKVILELGDVLWYLSLLARAMHSSLADVATTNLHKLRARYPDGFTTKASLARADELSFGTLVSEDDLARAFHGQGGEA